MNDQEDPLTATIRGVLKSCLEADFYLPLHTAVVGVNGSVLFTRYTADARGELQPEMLAEHFVDEFFKLPINIMITDARGEAARVVINAEGETSSLMLH